jgi:UDP-3-O-[3-hydroxymyristoyl] glucosamine N-acyltransferase
MRFSQLIAVLQDGEAGLLEHQLGSNPELRGAASL